MGCSTFIELLVMFLLLGLLTTIDARTRSNEPQRKTSIFKNPDCGTEQTFTACGTAVHGWLQGLPECCPGYRCVNVLQKSRNTHSGYRIVPKCRRSSAPQSRRKFRFNRKQG